jgi:choline dehydrogenase-like flavoprotein
MSGADLDLEQRLPELFRRLPTEADRRQLALLLVLLSSHGGGLLLHGIPKPLASLTAEGRALAYRRMTKHPVGLIRAGARALKTLLAAIWVTTEDASAPPVSWQAMGYPGPDGPAPPTPRPLQVLDAADQSSMSCDVVVVGSGAGGATAAAVLAGAGLDVVVLEAGGYRNESDFSHLEADAYASMYLDGALGTTADKGTIVLAGATLGGGTVINYTTSFPTPDEVRREWDRVAGLPGVFTGDDFQDSLDRVTRRLSVNREHGTPSSRDRLMEEGLRRLGWHVDEMPRNVDDCTPAACGYCTMGCRLGAKRSTMLTYLEDASHAGARIVVGAKVDRVLIEAGKAVGVLARSGGNELRVRARAVVLAAGALHTPAIMLRSGIGGPAVGDYLRLHPVTALWARFSQRIDPWTGMLQTRYSDQFADLDGNGYGFRFETAAIHPLFPAAFIGWDDGAVFKRDVLGLGHLDVAGILLRDRDHGKVVVRRDGSPLWKYRISRRDQAHVREGVRRGVELYAAAGAEEIIASTVRPVRWRMGGDVESFVAEADAVGYGSNQTTYFTFHQMGSARMGADPGLSVVDGDNEAHDILGLFVMDGSCFPTSSGVNPMITIAAIAHRGATRLAERLD